MKNKALVIIISIAAFLRFYNLTQVPASLSEKEAAFGYKFYTVFGIVLNEFWVRFPTAVIGVLCILAIYLTAWYVTKSKNVALLSALFLAISPWHVHLSRTDIASSLIILLFTVQIFLLQLKNSKMIICLGLVANQILMCFVHPIGWVLSLLTVFWIFKNLKTINAKLLTCFVLIFAVLFFITKDSFQNFYFKSAFYNEIGFINHINKNRGEVSDSRYEFIRLPLVQNKATAFIDQIARNYVRSFDFYYLILEDNSKEKQTVYQFGKFYAIELLFFFIGIYFFVKRKLDKNYLLVTLFIIPLGGILSLIPNLNQTLFTLVIPFYVITAFGTVSLLQQSKKGITKTLTLSLFSLLLILSSITFFNFYFKIYPTLSYNEWNFGYKQISEKLESVEKYDKIVISDRISTSPEIYFNFYQNNNPKFNFRGIGTQESDFEKGNLLVVSEEEMRTNQIVDCLEKEKCSLVDKVIGPDGKVIFNFVEFI